MSLWHCQTNYKASDSEAAKQYQIYKRQILGSTKHIILGQ